MFECKGLVGKVIGEATIHEDCNFGPEISLSFTDGTVFSFCVSNRSPVEAKLTRNEGGGSFSAITPSLTATDAVRLDSDARSNRSIELREDAP